MPFMILPGVEGKVYVPEHDSECLRKHDCRNCFSCQMCSDDRCALCLEEETSCPKIKKVTCHEKALTEAAISSIVV